MLWGLPDWAVRVLAHVAAIWAPLVALIAAGVLVYLHKYTTGVIMRWLMIPIAVSMALGFVGLRLISVGKHIELSAPAQLFASFPDWVADDDFPKPLPVAPLPTPPVTVTTLPAPMAAVPVYEDASDTPHRIDVPTVSKSEKVATPKLSYHRKKKDNRVKFQTYWGF